MIECSQVRMTNGGLRLFDVQCDFGIGTEPITIGETEALVLQALHSKLVSVFDADFAIGDCTCTNNYFKPILPCKSKLSFFFDPEEDQDDDGQSGSDVPQKAMK